MDNIQIIVEDDINYTMSKDEVILLESLIKDISRH